VTKDDDYVLHESVEPDLICAHKEGLAKPDKEQLRLDFTQGPESPWNSEVLEMLVESMKWIQGKSNGSIPERSNAYYLQLARDKFARARSAWARGQQQSTGAGEVEAAKDVEACLITENFVRLKKARARQRRVTVSPSLGGQGVLIHLPASEI
jgi:hypothetical protein